MAGRPYTASAVSLEEKWTAAQDRDREQRDTWKANQAVPGPDPARKRRAEGITCSAIARAEPCAMI